MTTTNALGIDLAAAEAEVVEHLQHLIRCETVNPPGNETLAATYLRDQLAAVGIESQLLEAVPNRANLVARWAGDGRARPLLLMGHTDVVPVEAARWTHPPFGGEIADGFLWGRGAVDMKNIDAIHLTVVRALKRAGLTLPRDVLLAFTADEEAGSTYGMEWVAQHHFAWVDAEYAISEGAGEEIGVGGRSFFGVQCGEKGAFRFRLRATGRPGHASIPHDDNCLVKLGRALDRLGTTRLPLHLTPAMRTCLTTLAGPPDAPAFDTTALFDPERHLDALARLPVDDELRRFLYAVTHNTCSPTMLHAAGSRINVIPSEAVAEVDGRPLPGVAEAEMLAEVQAAIGHEVAIEEIRYKPGLESDINTPMFRMIEDVMAAAAPGSRVVPILSSGGTDARSLVPRGVKVYGFSPARVVAGEPSPVALMHNHDERISLANLQLALRVELALVMRLMGLSPA
ncbi:MAG TPA: M20/M25/M40 family metallo-hydrolase [Chloroflexia bacterium]|nr:M20/M25/M40 family metallo-hydrolase [Chloroflexia bacterium]